MPPVFSPLVTLFVPAYNVAGYIDETMASLFAQTFTNFELLIIDDGSTDGTQARIAAYSDPRIRFLQNSENKGVAFTANRGFAEAKAKYLVRIDSDDIMPPDRLEKQVKFMEAHPDIMVSSGFACCFGTMDAPVRYKITHDKIAADLLFACPLMQGAAIFRMEFIRTQKILYHEDLMAAEDYDLWFRIICDHNGKVANIPHILNWYRIHPASLSFTKRQHMWEADSQVRQRYLRLLVPTLTQADIERQDKLYHSALDINEQVFKEILVWFEQLLCGNETAQLFDQKSFAHTLCTKLLEIAKPLFYLGPPLYDAIFSFSGFNRIAYPKAAQEKIRKQIQLYHEHHVLLSQKIPFVPWDGQERLRILFLISQPEDWLSIASVWQAMNNCHSFSPIIVASGPYTDLILATCALNNAPVIAAASYVPADHLPHLAFCIRADEEGREEHLRFEALEALGVRSIYMPAVEDLWFWTAQRTMQPDASMYMRFWRYYLPTVNTRLAFNKLHPAIARTAIKATGLPALDELTAQRIPIPAAWKEKIQNRTVFLWSIDTATQKLFMPEVSQPDWLFLFQDLVPFFTRKQNSAALIIRPTDGSWQRLCQDTGLSTDEMIAMKNIIVESSNLLLDENQGYIAAVECSHAAIIDTGPFSLNYAAFGEPFKPFCLTCLPSETTLPSWVTPLCEAGYTCDSPSQVKNFISMVMQKKDPLGAQRKKTISEVLGSRDRQSGLRVMATTLEAMRQELEA